MVSKSKMFFIILKEEHDKDKNASMSVLVKKAFERFNKLFPKDLDSEDTSGTK